MNLHEKTNVLIEALPYIKKYAGKIVVIKFGGNALSEISHLVEDIVLLKHIGINPIVVHGGGPEINKELEKQKIPTKFIQGLRHTDEKTIKVVKKVFKKINASIVKSINSQGAKSASIDNCIKVKQKDTQLGLVGEIIGIKERKILKSIKNGKIPVISPIGIDSQSIHYNINADTAAAYIAVHTKAEKLTIITNVDGIIINQKLLSHIDFDSAKAEIQQQTINKGMIPKVEACIFAVSHKCPKAHLINGLIPHSLLLEIFTDKGIGTEIVYKNEN